VAGRVTEEPGGSRAGGGQEGRGRTDSRRCQRRLGEGLQRARGLSRARIYTRVVFLPLVLCK